LDGERDLARLLDALDPQLHVERYSFSVATDSALKESQFAIVREDEGLTAIGTDPDGNWARISLGVHSSLDAVGLTAALATRLAGLGISANIVAGRLHDHLFVPWDRREEALESLRSV
jgi:uncharacterized protein